MLTRLLHALVARPMVYSLCQRSIGAGGIPQRIVRHVPPGRSRTLDVGAGAGHTGRMWPKEASYIPLDEDRTMLRAGGRMMAVQSDATELPFVDGCMDVVLCKQVSHHIPDELLDRLFQEIRRVLRKDGRFIFMDAVRTGRTASELMWRYDRGSHPREEPDLVAHLERHFSVVHREEAWNLHLYVLYVLTPLATCVAAASEVQVRAGG